MEKVLLINPPDKNIEKVDKDKAGGLGTLNYYAIAPNPPLDLLQTGSILENQGHEVDILDSVVEGMDTLDVLNKLEFKKMHFIGIRLSLPSLAEDLDFANSIKEKISKQFHIFIWPGYKTYF